MPIPNRRFGFLDHSTIAAAASTSVARDADGSRYAPAWWIVAGVVLIAAIVALDRVDNAKKRHFG
jgi:hypothetical protein